MTHWRTDLENVPEYPAEFLVWHKGPNGYASVTVKGSGEFDYDEEPTITHWAVISTPFDGETNADLTDEQYQKCNEYALRLVLSLASRFPAVEGFHAFPDLYGKLSQIDNMTCKLPLGFGNSGGTK